MHLAAQCGSLESLNCLLALRADYKLVDKRGWMAIHFAAFYGQVACIQALCRKDPALLEMKTTAEYMIFFSNTFRCLCIYCNVYIHNLWKVEGFFNGFERSLTKAAFIWSTIQHKQKFTNWNRNLLKHYKSLYGLSLMINVMHPFWIKVFISFKRKNPKLLNCMHTVYLIGFHHYIQKHLFCFL